VPRLQAARADPVVWTALLLAAAGVLLVLRAALIIRLHIPINSNEGWNAYHATDLVAGRPLYQGPRGFFFNNYPPLSFYIVAAWGMVLGDPMLAGRSLSLLSLVAWPALLAIIAKRLGCRWSESAFAALLLLTGLFLFNDFNIAVNDPELLGHAVQALGLLVLLRERRTTLSLLAAAALLAAGVFIKHLMVSLPMAAVLWLVLVDRRAAWRIATFGALLAAAGLAISITVFGPAFLAQLLAPRAYLPARAGALSAAWIGRWLVPMAVSAVLARNCFRDSRVALGLIIAAVATPVGLLLFGGDGVYWNNMFDAEWALCLNVALALNRLPGVMMRPSRARLRLALVAGSLALPVSITALGAQIHWGSPRYWLDPRWYEAETAARDIAFIRDRPGPALCEQNALCFWAGKPVEVDFYGLNQRVRRDPSRADEVARRIEARQFAVALLGIPTQSLGRRFDEALQRNYRIDHQNEWGVFWVPK
jgi:hypothetical protein